mmetsp:Transcript_26931/g.58884  ORF Transcript_26931/g.58884 Transcript_26931/m.58884 type:complete len:212 (+) Transcript_26931:59-694(+)
MASHHIDRLRSFGHSLDVPHPQRRTHHHAHLPRASVLVGLFQDENDETHVLLTKRPEKLKSHPGQVCFPGGRQEECDGGNDIATALRETKEEVGVATDSIEPVCIWDSVESVNGLCVTPVIARIKKPFDIEKDLTLCPREVDAAFAVPLRYFADEANCASAEEIEWKGGKFTMRTYHYACPLNQREFTIWGLTAGIVHHVAQIACSSEGRS